MHQCSYMTLTTVLLLGIAACSGEKKPAEPDSDRDGGGSADAAQHDAEDASTTDDGTYFDGEMLCCAKGTGVACCTAPGRLGYDVPDDGGPITSVGDVSVGPTANCFSYGGSGQCTAHGGTFDRKMYCTVCCDGLVAVELSEVGEDGACAIAGPISAALCVPCGNGSCDEGENLCNCPADCE